ncbi:hypothetical protein EJB05_29384, partial [Eragrostis curvula]
MDKHFKNIHFISWNVRGLGDVDKCKLVCDNLTSALPTIICLQESNLDNVDRFKAATFLPTAFTTLYSLDADGTRGGILTAWGPSIFTLSSFTTRRHTLTTTLHSTTTDLAITITNVYAPSDHRDSQIFLDGLIELAPHITGPWILAGDFNLVRDAADKNNDAINLGLADAFNSTINQLQLMELSLLDCLVHLRSSPTLARLYHVFLNLDINSLCPNNTLTSITRTTSDHIPLLVTISTAIPKPSIFRFDVAWFQHNDFLPAVLPAWYSTQSPGRSSGHLVGSLKSARHAAK